VDEYGRDGVDVVVSRAAWMDAQGEDRYLEAEIDGADLFHSLTGHWLPAEGRGGHGPRPYPRCCVRASPAPSGEKQDAGLPSRSDAPHTSSSPRIRPPATPRQFSPAAVPPMTVIPKAAAPVFRLGVPAEATLERYGLQPDGFLLALGGVGPHKNLDRLLEGYGQSGVDTPLIITAQKTTRRRFVAVSIGTISVAGHD
jgi:hypothetical protein